MQGTWTGLLGLTLLLLLATKPTSGQLDCPPRCLCFRTTVRCMFHQLSIVPEQIPPQTTVLDLRFNKIRVIPSHTFRHLKNLNTLLLNNNQITRIEDNAFLGLKELRHLYLYKNRIHFVSKHAFRGLPKLEQLYLHFNKIQTLEDETFGNLPALERLFLHHNQLSRLPRKAFQRLDSLRRLRLDSNALVCDCEMLWLVEMLEGHRRDEAESVQAAATCQEPGRLQGKALQTLRKDDFNCRRPNLLQEPNDVEVTFGGTAYFHCRAEGDPDPDITWYHNSNEIPRDGPENERMSLLSKGSTLMITSAEEKDQGLYECMARNVLGETKSRAARMNYKHEKDRLLEEPRPSGTSPEFLVQPTDVRATEGSEVTFHCSARGNPSPEIVWMQSHQTLTPGPHNNNILEERFRIAGSGSLTISPVRIEDAGPYRCLATNSAGRVVATANLHVNVPPRILNWTEADERVAVAGQTIDLVCRTEGDPTPRLTWLKDGRPLEVRGRRTLLLHGGAVFRLNRARAVLDDGLYSCQASSQAGRDQRQVRLRVISTRAAQRNADRTQPSRDVPPQSQSNQERTPETSDEEPSRRTLLETSVSAAKVEVDRAINATLAEMFQNRTDSASGLSHLFRALRFPDPEAREVARAAEIFQRAMEMLHHHIQASSKTGSGPISLEELRILANLSGCFPTSREERRRPSDEEECDDWCFHSRFRTVDGRCNNLQRPQWGSALTPFKRLLPPRYLDGIQEPIGWNPSKTANGHPYPSARLVSSTAVMTNHVTPDPEYSHMLMQWGQFLDHDLDFSMPALSHSSFSDGSSCLTSCENRAPCFPIPIPVGDHSRSNSAVPDRPCIEVVRSSALCGSGLPSLLTNQTSTREQVNQLTSYLDASNIYGSSSHVNSLVRDRGSSGLLRTSRHSGRVYLPYAEGFPMDCHRDRNGPATPCFLAGDVRANEQLGLLAMHTLWVREHNRLARRLLHLNPGWDAERIYQEARKIVGAIMQHVTYTHWLPKILGKEGMDMLGPYTGYNPDLEASVSNVFATAALRFGHTLINPVLERLGPGWDSIPEGPVPLHQAFFAPHRLLTEGGVDPLLRGLVGAPAKLRVAGQLLNEELIDKLFTLARDVALDLGAINIQRGRDHGIPSYWEWRQLCNLTRAHSFEDLRHEIHPSIRNKIADLYGHPDNIDLWVGGVSEDLAPGARVGPTFRCLLVEQFRRLRYGDRFWYENPGVFSPAQLTEIRRSSLGGVLCASGDAMTQMTSDIFQIPGPRNSIADCSLLPKLQLQPWKECCAAQDCSASSNSVLTNRYQRAVNEGPLQKNRTPRSSSHLTESAVNELSHDQQMALDASDIRVEGIENVLSTIKGKLRQMSKKLKHQRQNAHCTHNSTIQSACTDSRGQRRSQGESWNHNDSCQVCTCQTEGRVFCQVTTPCPGG